MMSGSFDFLASFKTWAAFCLRSDTETNVRILAIERTSKDTLDRTTRRPCRQPGVLAGESYNRRARDARDEDDCGSSERSRQWKSYTEACPLLVESKVNLHFGKDNRWRNAGGGDAESEAGFEASCRRGSQEGRPGRPARVRGQVGGLVSRWPQDRRRVRQVQGLRARAGACRPDGRSGRDRTCPAISPPPDGLRDVRSDYAEREVDLLRNKPAITSRYSTVPR